MKLELKKIREQRQNWIDAINDNDVKRVAEYLSNDAVWMVTNHASVPAPWAYTYAQRSGDNALYQEYYNRVEESLNLAVQSCISAMIYIVGGEAGGNLPGFTNIFPIFILSSVILIFIVKNKVNREHN